MRVNRVWMDAAEGNLAEYKRIHRACIDEINLRIAATARLLSAGPPAFVPDARKWALYRALTQIKGAEARAFVARRVNFTAFSGPLTPEQYAAYLRILRLAMLAQEMADALEYYLLWLYDEAIARAAYGVQREARRIWAYSTPGKARARARVGAAWYGSTYKTRVWAGAEAAVSAMESGVEPPEALQRWRSAAERLVNAEGEHAESLGVEDAYADMGITQYQYISLMEANTCKRCEGLHGNVYYTYQSVPGQNYPPMHPWCQCTTRPVVGKGRAAPSGSETMPDGMTLAEWREAQKQYNPGNRPRP